VIWTAPAPISASAVLVLRSISSFRGQAGVVSSIVNATSVPVIAMSLTMLSVTMSRPSSGSWTLRRASKIAPSVMAGIGSRTSADRDWISAGAASISSSYSGTAGTACERARPSASEACLPVNCANFASGNGQRRENRTQATVVATHLAFLTPRSCDTYSRTTGDDLEEIDVRASDCPPECVPDHVGLVPSFRRFGRAASV
jgi:hypothetical protein